MTDHQDRIAQRLQKVVEWQDFLDALRRTYGAWIIWRWQNSRTRTSSLATAQGRKSRPRKS